MPVKTVVVSGMHSGTNPSPGLGVARSLKLANPNLRVVGLDYSPESSGLHSDVIDDRILMPTWHEIDLDVWNQQVKELADGGAVIVSCLDLEVRLLAESDRRADQFLSPGRAALQWAVKPPLALAAALGMNRADSLAWPCDASDLADFVRRSPGGVWVKGQHYEAFRAFDGNAVMAAGAHIDKLWGSRWHVERHVSGQEAGLAFVARDGQLLAAVLMRKTMLTPTGKTWAGEVTPVPPSVAERLSQWVRDSGWNGGGEIELIESWDGRWTLMEMNPRLPAWIHGATVTGVNLPAALVDGVANPGPSRLGSFTRVVEEIRSDQHLDAPSFPWSADQMMSASTKHPSGMPVIGQRGFLHKTTVASQPAVTGPAREPATAALHRAHQEADTPTRHAMQAAAVTSEATPVLTLHSAALVTRLNTVRDSLDSTNVSFAYSVKTNPDRRLMSDALLAGMHMEVISQDELAAAKEVGCLPQHVILNGPAKWWPEPKRPVAARAVFADSVGEFTQINRLIDNGLLLTATVLGIRLTHTRMRSRFGTDIDDREGLGDAAAELCRLRDRLDSMWGLHFHSAASVVGVEQWVLDCATSLRAAGRLTALLGSPPSLIDFGGGWHSRDLRFLPEAVKAVADAVSDEVDLHAVPWVFELGKSLVEACGTLYSRVLVGPNRRGDVVIDAGVSDLPEGPYWAHPVTVVVDEAVDSRREPLQAGAGRLVGRTCMERDVLATNLDVSQLRPGDLLAFANTGGYDTSMAYPFGRGQRLQERRDD